MLKKLSDHLYCFTDTCNVYVLVDGEEALLIDSGSGAVLDHLEEIGVKRVAWVLHTHHHRDQCWGAGRLVEAGAKIAVPEYERHLFEEAERFWQARRVYDNYDCRNNFFAAAADIPVDATLDDYAIFVWRDFEFFILPAKGHSVGSSTLLVEIDRRLVGFSGDLINRGGVLYQLHAIENRYGDMSGALFTLESIQALRHLLRGEPVGGKAFKNTEGAVLLPSHGAGIDDPAGDIDHLEMRITELFSLGRNMSVAGRDAPLEGFYLPEPKFVPISRHLLWGGNWTCSFFYVLLSESGKAMFIDYGHGQAAHMNIGSDHGMLGDRMRFVEHHLRELRQQWGVEGFDLAVPTHIHDDHTAGIPHLQRHYETRCYALDTVARVLTDPAAWASTPCTFHQPIRIDRTLADGERFEWEEYTFEVFFAPGQTEYHSVLAAEIDGKRVAFTGDNLFFHDVLEADRVVERPYQTTVLRNSFQLGMHRRCAEVMKHLQPDLICPGHRRVYPFDRQKLADYVDFIARKERVFRNLVAEPADHFIDLFWVRLLPYLSTVEAGRSAAFTLLVRNNQERPAEFAAKLLPPSGWEASESFENVALQPGESGELRLSALAPATDDGCRRLVTAEVSIDGVSQGPVAEALVTVE